MATAHGQQPAITVCNLHVCRSTYHWHHTFTKNADFQNCYRKKFRAELATETSFFFLDIATHFVIDVIYKLANSVTLCKKILGQNFTAYNLISVHATTRTMESRIYEKPTFMSLPLRRDRLDWTRDRWPDSPIWQSTPENHIQTCMQNICNLRYNDSGNDNQRGNEMPKADDCDVLCLHSFAIYSYFISTIPWRKAVKCDECTNPWLIDNLWHTRNIPDGWIMSADSVGWLTRVPW